jgi:hypothetical protein
LWINARPIESWLFLKKFGEHLLMEQANLNLSGFNLPVAGRAGLTENIGLSTK